MLVHDRSTGGNENNNLVHDLELKPKKFIKMFTERKYSFHNDTMHGIMAPICALRNSEGGTLAISFTKTCSKSEAKDCAEIVKDAGYKVLSDTSMSDISELKHSPPSYSIKFQIKGSKELVTMDYNTYVLADGKATRISSNTHAKKLRSFVRDKLEEEKARQYSSRPSRLSRLRRVLRFPSRRRERRVLQDISASVNSLPNAVSGKTKRFQLVKNEQFRGAVAKSNFMYRMLEDDNDKRSVAYRITLDQNELLPYVCAFANRHGGRLYYGISRDGIVSGETVLENEIDEVKGKIDQKIESMLIWPKHIGGLYEINFLPVNDSAGANPKIQGQSVFNPNLYVIKITVHPCQGIVFVKNPESYHIVENKIERLPFPKWIALFLKHSNAEESDSENLVELGENRNTFDRRYFPTECLKSLESFKWVEGYKMVDANEECSERHLEIFCKIDEVPRTADIVKLFGKKVLPFITYKKCSQHQWFETNVLDEHFNVEGIFKEELTRLEWVHDLKIVDANEEYDARHLEIVCKLGEVPRTTDIVKRFGKKILPFITYKKCSQHKWLVTNVLDGNFGVKKIFKEKLTRLDWVHDFKIVDANEKRDARHLEIVCKLGDVPCTRDIENIFGKEILPVIIYEKCMKREWFVTNILGEKKYKSQLASLSWVKDFYVGVVNEPEKSWQIFITCDQNKVPPKPMVELKKMFGVDIASFVDFVQGDSEESLPSPIFFLRGPRSGDELCIKVEDKIYTGTLTIGILGVDKNHYVTTCYHVCYTKDLPKDFKKAHETLKNDCANELSQNCRGATCMYRVTDEEERILGQFCKGLYSDDHDIALIELDSSLNCTDAVNFLKLERIEKQLADEKQVQNIFYEMDSKVPVEKFGSVTGKTEGQLFALDGGSLFPSTDEAPCYRIRGIDGKAFAKEGDSGSLVYAVYDGRRIPFGYVSMGVPDGNIYSCRNLLLSIQKLVTRIQPCLDDH